MNIWTPAINDGGKRPVFFYIHGGGFSSGSGGYPFSGDPMARLGNAVVITVNHRLGPLGFLDLGPVSGDPKFEKSGVAGMLDLVSALEWVQENISNFGGDPGWISYQLFLLMLRWNWRLKRVFLVLRNHLLPVSRRRVVVFFNVWW